jgi:hypothetical protein
MSISTQQYGFWRQYIDCSDLHNGFARYKMLLINGNPHLNAKSKNLYS